jgi:hypothetical protein
VGEEVKTLLDCVDGATLSMNGDGSRWVIESPNGYSGAGCAGVNLTRSDMADIARFALHGDKRSEEPDRERIEFIRRAAIEIWRSWMQNRSATDAWTEAKALWEAKPDDC